MSKTKVYEWYKCFQKGHEDNENDECTGHPSISMTNKNIKKVEEVIMEDRRISIGEVPDHVGKSTGLCREIFSSVLGMKLVATKFVPKV